MLTVCYTGFTQPELSVATIHPFVLQVAAAGESIFYGTAFGEASALDLEDAFFRDYGIAGDWEDVETGRPIRLDAGEFVSWVKDQTR